MSRFWTPVLCLLLSGISYAGYGDVAPAFITTPVKHMSMSLFVDFEEKILKGDVTYTLADQHGFKLVLDVDQLDLVKAIDLTLQKEIPLEDIIFSFNSEDPNSASTWTIPVSENTKKILIAYRTRPGSKALRWLDPDHATGRVSPFMFTAGESVHDRKWNKTRGWLPCQDSPASWISFDASVSSTDKNLLAVMSAPVILREEYVDYFRTAPNSSVTPYMIGLAVGDLQYQPISPHAGIYAEAGKIKAAAAEFAQLEKMVQVVEELAAAPRENIRLLILPSSFSDVGLENPNLVYVDPKDIVGDRSGLSKVVHTLSHHWFGKSMNAPEETENFWLNEGIAVYFEHKIMQEVNEHLADVDLNSQIQKIEKSQGVENRKSIATSRFMNYLNPEEIESAVRYSKGYFFLLEVEKLVGPEYMIDFLLSYTRKYMFKPVTMETLIGFLRYFIQQFPELVEKLELVNWVSKSETPNYPEINRRTFAMVDYSLSQWNEGKVSEIDTSLWLVDDWRYFLLKLPQKISVERMDQVNQLIKESKLAMNPLIQVEWLYLVAVNSYWTEESSLKEFLMKDSPYVGAFYSKLAETQYGLQLASDVFELARSQYSPALRTQVADILGVELTNLQKF